MVGWSTLFGDDSGCYAPLKDLTCTEVKIVGEKIGVPDFIIKKAPSDGLCGKTDEDALGFSYATLDMYIRTGYCEKFEDEIKIEEMYNKAKFKQELIQLPHPELGLPNYLKTHNEPRIEIPENLFDT
jgi:NAD+ synthase